MALKKKITAILGFLGLISALAGVFVYMFFEEKVWLYTTLELLAVLQLSLFFVTHFEMLKDFSSQRSTKFGLNSILMVVIFVTILSILNFILARHELRFDFSDAGTFSLSPQTENVLEHLKDEVKFIGFFTDDSKIRSKARDLLENYKRESNKVSYIIVDPDKKPAMTKQYGITEYDKIIVESEGRATTARNITEEALTSALIRSSRKTKKTIYFVEGHGESSIDDTKRNGYALIKDALQKQGFTVKKLLLLSKGHIPGDADVVIIGGPKRSFTAGEFGSIQKYLEGNGRLFLAIDPMLETGFETFLAPWGLQLKDDIILDPGSGMGAAIPTINPGSYPPHEITQNFNLATFFPLSRSVSFDASLAGTYQFSPILQSGPDTWLTTQVAGELRVDPARDRKGPIVFGGVLTPVTKDTSSSDTESDTKKQMRIVVVGDSDFGTNSIARAAGNGDLFQNIISWLADEGDLVSIRPKEVPTTTLLLNDKQMGIIFSVSVLILPFGIMGIGLMIWRKRRRL